MSKTESHIRRAVPTEAAFVSDLAFRSKAYWGYAAEFMAACRAELTFDGVYLEENPTFVLEVATQILGFYSLEPLSTEEVELGTLFVEPAAIGQGYGRALMSHAKQQAQRLGYRRLIIQADPHAERFYRAAGGQVIGRKPSASLSGRELPLLAIDLKA